MRRPNTMRALRLLAVAATAGVLAACGSSDSGDESVLEPGPPDGTDDTSEPRDIVGTTWALNEATTKSGDSITPGEDAYVEFTEDGQLSANSGCNGYGGNVTVEGNLITLGEVIGTQRACSGATGEVDKAFSQVLQGSLTAKVSGDSMTLEAADGGSLTFTAGSGE